MQFRPHRYRTEFPTVLATPTGNVKAVINDVNETGALMSIASQLQRGDKITVRFLNTQAVGIVQWSLKDKCGVTFRPHLTIAQVDQLRYKQGGHRSARHSSTGYAEMR